MTIIKDISAYRDFPYESLSAEAVIAFSRACVSESERKSVGGLCKSLECFLQITDQKLCLLDITTSPAKRCLELFKGALCSSEFRDLKSSRRLALIVTLNKLVSRINGCCITTAHKSKKSGLNHYLQEKDAFEKLTLNQEKVWLWSAWPCTNASGINTNITLLGFYNRFGRAFTDELYVKCVSFLATRRVGHIEAIDKLNEFVQSEDCIYSREDLLTPERSTTFWHDFFVHYYKASVFKSHLHAAVIARWRGPISNFVNLYMLKSNLFATPYDFPTPQANTVPGADSHIVDFQGTEYKNKLIVKIPLQISDDQAFKAIKAGLLRGKELIEAWCDFEISKSQSHLEAYNRLKYVGVPVKAGVFLGDKRGNRWLLSRNNPECLANMAATLHVHGFDILVSSMKGYGAKLTGVGVKLGLPTTDSLLPFCLKLILSDPRITPSFLASIELYDKNGNIRGVENGDLVTYLHGFKDRKGPNKAEIRIKLKAESIELLKTIIAMTAPLRMSLKNSCDDSWRTLLLTAKGGTGNPVRYYCKTNNSSYKVVEVLRRLRELFPNDPECTKDLAAALLRPTAVRATAAVAVFLKTGSVHAMASALGHVRYEADLLERYLPKGILYFFRDRWVRRFQTGIIVQAMRGSSHLLQATGFLSLEELTDFLENHSLNIQDSASKQNLGENNYSGKAVISVNLDIARILITLREARKNSPRKLNARAEHWAEFGDHLSSYLNADSENQLEAIDIFEQAEVLGPLKSLDNIIYEHLEE